MIFSSCEQIACNNIETSCQNLKKLIKLLQVGVYIGVWLMRKGTMFSTYVFITILYSTFTAMNINVLIIILINMNMIILLSFLSFSYITVE